MAGTCVQSGPNPFRLAFTRFTIMQPLPFSAPRSPGHRVRVVLCAGLIGLGLSQTGCSHTDIPRAQQYPVSDQYKARAVHHWNLLADDVAERIAAAALPDTSQSTGAYHLQASSATPFQKAFSSLLLTRLVNKGVPMATLPVDGEQSHARIRFDVQVVEHSSAALNLPQFPLTILATGLSVLRGFYLYPPTELGGAAMGVAGAMLVDQTNRVQNGHAAGGPTRTELLVSTTVVQGQRIVARTSDVYYIDSDDVKLFVEPPPPPVVAPTPVKNWKVTG